MPTTQSTTISPATENFNQTEQKAKEETAALVVEAVLLNEKVKADKARLELLKAEISSRLPQGGGLTVDGVVGHEGEEFIAQMSARTSKTLNSAKIEANHGITLTPADYNSVDSTYVTLTKKNANANKAKKAKK